MRLFGAEQSHRGTVRKDRSKARFLKRIDGRVGMLRRVDDVAPVEKGGYPGIDLIECSDEVSYVRVLRCIEPNDFPNEHTEIVIERPIRSNTAQCRLPEMNMAIDKTRHSNHATAVDFFNGPPPYVAADCYNFFIIDQQVARLDDSQRGIH